MIRQLPYACCLGLLALATACHSDCYTWRQVVASGRFGDTLVAVSGNMTQPGTVEIEIVDQSNGKHPSRGGNLHLNPGTIGTAALFNLTRFSDASRFPVLSSTIAPRAIPTDPIFMGFSVGATQFDKLFTDLTTEDVLFELVASNGTVAKARLNVERHDGPREVCENW